MSNEATIRKLGLMAAGVGAVVNLYAYNRRQAATAEAKVGKVKRIALTGGPCGGKSSSLKAFTKVLKANNVDVYCVPEIPTILMTGNCQYPGIEGDTHKLFEFEAGLIQLQIQAEDSFIRIARSTGRDSVVVMDRGLLDVAAYLPKELWTRILQANGYTEQGFASRYDMVLHLVTAANGAEKFYTTANNAARTETAEQARALDDKMQACWSAHNNLKVVPNPVGGFADKMAMATGFVSDLTKGMGSTSA